MTWHDTWIITMYKFPSTFIHGKGHTSVKVLTELLHTSSSPFTFDGT